MWYVNQRFANGYQLLEGSGKWGGLWAVKRRGEFEIFKSRRDAIEHIEISIGE